jgi:hypothetical protein
LHEVIFQFCFNVTTGSKKYPQVSDSVQILCFSNFNVFVYKRWRVIYIANASPFYKPSIGAFSYCDLVLNIAIDKSKKNIFESEMVCIGSVFRVLLFNYFRADQLLRGWFCSAFLSFCLELLLCSCLRFYCRDSGWQREMGEFKRNTVMKQRSICKLLLEI